MGQSSQAQTTSSSSQPWAPAQPALQGILSGLGGLVPQAGSLSPIQQSALTGLQNNAAAGNPYASAIGSSANQLLAGGGANNQAGLLSGALSQYQQQLAPFLQSSYLNPMNTPGFSQALGTLNQDISNQINGQFAGAGRDLSPANSTYLARGLSQGEGQLLANQYNQNVQNQLGAFGNLYNAANTTGGLLSGLQQTALANQQAGTGQAQAALNAQNYGPQLALYAAAQQLGIPTSQLAALTGIAQPIAGLGGQTAGQMTGANTPSALQDFYLAASGLGGLFKGAGALGGGGG